MITYHINMIACALLLYAMYILLLEKENMHRFKRIYLLACLVFSMMVPFTTITVNIPQIPANMGMLDVGLEKVVEIADNQTLIIESATQVEEIPATVSVNYYLLILLVYVLITSLFLFRLLGNCRQMLARGRKNACMDYHGAKIALMDEKSVPYSFGRYIFINREDYNSGRVPNEIIVHEWAHVRQRHSWDIVFIELLIAFGWFNPVFYLYRNKIKQNHEFLADDAVIGNNRDDVPVYQTILMNLISQNKNKNLILASNFNFLTTKKRIVMMTKTTSRKRAWCTRIALIPVFIAAICVFSTKCVVPKNNPVMDNDRRITCGEGVSQELLTEYQEIVSKYLEKCIIGNSDESDKYYWNTDQLPEKDWTLLYVIFAQMTESQRMEQKIRLWGPPLWVPPNSTDTTAYPPNEYLYDFCKYYGKIWIDGERADNSVLNSCKRTDFFRYYCSSLLREGKKVGKKDECRIDLWTKTGYEKFREQFFEQPISIGKLLEIEPRIEFVMEEKNNKLLASLTKDPISGWTKTSVDSTGRMTTMGRGKSIGLKLYYSDGLSSPLTYYQKTE